ncbi:hypothetical protein N9F34_04025 [Alphaproteobacteria bacterium]|nr:hypothetical protein [Alphaproteobacteria bacterium]
MWEFVQVLRLIETFPPAMVHGAVRNALRLGGRDAMTTPTKRPNCFSSIT